MIGIRNFVAGMAGVAIALFPSYPARPEPDNCAAVERFVGNWNIVSIRRGDETDNNGGQIQLECSDGRIIGAFASVGGGFLEFVATDRGQLEGSLWLFGLAEKPFRIPLTAEMQESQELTLLLMMSDLEADSLPAEFQEEFQEDLTIVAKLLTEEERSQQLAERGNKARQAEARNYLGAMNRAQQAYHLEQNRFTNSLSELGIGIRQETENYSYGLRLLDETTVQHTATPKKEGIESYTGIVYLTEVTSGGITEEVTRAILCESESPDRSEPPPPQMREAEPSCPAGFRDLAR
ncbi:MAG: hypothetical protein F6J93_29240 [Oscillatoria sp. SIO1A7]|nr:hypothetical protein [Oscillatoria sp. SIO1A7]